MGAAVQPTGARRAGVCLAPEPPPCPAYYTPAGGVCTPAGVECAPSLQPWALGSGPTYMICLTFFCTLREPKSSRTCENRTRNEKNVRQNLIPRATAYWAPAGNYVGQVEVGAVLTWPPFRLTRAEYQGAFYSMTGRSGWTQLGLALKSSVCSTTVNTYTLPQAQAGVLWAHTHCRVVPLEPRAVRDPAHPNHGMVHRRPGRSTWSSAERTSSRRCRAPPWPGGSGRGTRTARSWRRNSAARPRWWPAGRCCWWRTRATA